jgi:hypothetical protein
MTIKFPSRRFLLFAPALMSLLLRAEENAPLRRTLFSVPMGPGHSISDVYTPVTHAAGHTFFVIPDANHRPTVTQQFPDGRVVTVFLDPKDDYRAFPDPHNGFSLGLDKEGYLHITGDMHQFGARHGRHGGYPYPERYDDKEGAVMLYWRSRVPWDVERGFEFLGAAGSTRALPGTSWTYGRFFNDARGELYYSSRVRSYVSKNFQQPDARRGSLAVGLYRYHSDSRSWTAVGGSIPHPRPGSVARFHPVFFWANSGRPDTGHAYQAFQAHFNVDIHNRIHFTACGHIGKSGKVVRLVYAYSDDQGETWHRADGTRIPGLPLQGDDDAPNLPDVVRDMGSSSIVKVVADGNQRPAVKVGQSHHSGWIVWKDDKWNTLQSLPANRGFQRPNGDVLFNAPWGIWTLDDLAAPRHLRKFAPSGLHTPSQVGTLLFDRLIGAGMNPDKTTATLYEIRLPSIAEKEAGGEKQLNEILE